MISRRDIAFVDESNRIEGISRTATKEELYEYERFMALEEITVDEIKKFVKVYQPNAVLRDKPGLNVRVGQHIAPKGGLGIRPVLEAILSKALELRGDSQGAYAIHQLYEALHPFTDCNGRSGRMLWVWMMKEAPLGFLHHWYYQSLECARKGSAAEYILK